MGVVADYIQVKMFSIISLIFLLSTAYGGDISLFEGNNGSQDEVCTLRSAILYSADYGTTITLYDSPNGDRSDDYVEIKVKGYTNNPVVIGSFESTKTIMLDNGFIEVIYHRNNGLDGKVSRAEVSVF